MDYFISIGVAALLQALEERTALIKFAPKFAKVFVAIERAAASNPTLAAAIVKARDKM